MAQKRRIIKLTPEQLREAEGEAFKYLDIKNGYSPYNGQKEISVSGNINGEEGARPITGDKIANSLTPQAYNRFRSYGSLNNVSNMREGVDIKNDANDDGVDDFYNNDELDVLSNGDENDNLVKIPEGVDYKCDTLLSAMRNLKPKQQAMVINKMLESIDLTSLPYNWRKELMLKLNTHKG